MPRPKRIDGANAIYHYLQKIIIPRDDAFSRELVLRLVLDLSIWLPLEAYRALPFLLPYCVRDATLRQRDWGTANPQGYLRDNNSLLKRLVANYTIHSPCFPAYHRAERGRNFTASHAWRWLRLEGGRQLSTAHPLAYSFVPNLAWLPTQIAKLTDREGSYAQQVLQAVAWTYYAPARNAHPAPLAAIWEALPPPALTLDLDLTQLNTFVVSPRSMHIRRANLRREITLITQSVEEGVPCGKSPHSVRYLPSLCTLPAGASADMRAWLAAYDDFLAHQS